MKATNIAVTIAPTAKYFVSDFRILPALKVFFKFPKTFIPFLDFSGAGLLSIFPTSISNFSSANDDFKNLASAPRAGVPPSSFTNFWMFCLATFKSRAKPGKDIKFLPITFVSVDVFFSELTLDGFLEPRTLVLITDPKMSEIEAIML